MPNEMIKPGELGKHLRERAAITADKEIFSQSGAARSHRASRFDLIPREFLEVIADRLEHGLAQKSEREVLQRFNKGSREERAAILNDDAFFLTMKTHAFNHLIDLCEGNFTEDDLRGHVGAIVWNVCMLYWRERKRLAHQNNTDDTAKPMMSRLKRSKEH